MLGIFHVFFVSSHFSSYRANVIKTPTNLTLQVDHVGHIVIHPETVQLKPNQQDDEYTIDVVGVNRGHFEISAIASPASAIEYDYDVFFFYLFNIRCFCCVNKRRLVVGSGVFADDRGSIGQCFCFKQIRHNSADAWINATHTHSLLRKWFQCAILCWFLSRM